VEEAGVHGKLDRAALAGPGAPRDPGDERGAVVMGLLVGGGGAV
jgi:hypothetical protein